MKNEQITVMHYVMQVIMELKIIRSIADDDEKEIMVCMFYCR